jgi:hypothetical protein
MHAQFCKDMGIAEPTYLDQYLKVFNRVPKDGSMGPTAVIEYYKITDATDVELEL